MQTTNFCKWFFPANLNLQRKGPREIFISFSQLSKTEIHENGMVRTLTSASFSSAVPDLSCSLQGEWSTQPFTVPSSLPETTGEENTYFFFSSTLVDQLELSS